MDINESYRLNDASREKQLSALAKKMSEHIVVLKNYVQKRRMEKNWEHFFDRDKKPNQILVVEANYDFTPIVILSSKNDSLAEKILSFRHLSEEVYPGMEFRYYVCGIIGKHVTSIWQMNTPEFLRFWTHLLGRGMKLEIWEDANPPKRQEIDTIYTLDFE
jgi:hypothetical protein